MKKGYTVIELILILVILSILSVFCFSGCSSDEGYRLVGSEPVEEQAQNDLIHCVMGESRGEGYLGMVYLSEALRNRGTKSGVYGCQAEFEEPEWVWEQARKAWKESATTNYVKGADHWGSTIVDKKWIKKMDKTMEFKVQYKSHRFYQS